MVDKMPAREVGPGYQLDTNQINARQKNSFVNQLERWHDNGVVFLDMSYVAYDEACYGNQARSEKADKYTWTATCDATGGESGIREAIEDILFPLGADTENKRNDVHIVFTARQTSSTLVTADGRSRKQPGGILGNAEALSKLGIRVISAQEAVNEITRLIHERDQVARQFSKNTGATLPSWVDQDSPSKSEIQ